ncbi:hypothetical protein GpartN1_g3199.t1 [Galdieria partita]|uniref:Fatty acid hydroxylase domain-containing protein n=1 Tax=Galdieria partita TaxID=83374 RepID=A0A9C7UQ06_9RHOD|nr:hypothetical protein GpartN1_g3199.t1 [Galdieria partita]
MQTTEVFGVSLPLSVACFLFQFVTYHITCGFFAIVDYYKLLPNYKLHNSDHKTYSQLLPRVVFNQVVFYLPSFILLQYLGIAFCSFEPKLSVWLFVADYLFYSFLQEIIFYSGHRFLLHSKWGFQLLGHELHHTTKGSVAVSQHYMAPIDYLIEIVITNMLPFFFMKKTNIYFELFVISLNTVTGPWDHSGYKYPVGESSFAHSMHHLRSSCSFGGSAAFTDWILKTAYYFYGYTNLPKIKESSNH